MYGIIPSEIGEINSLSEEIGVDSKELMYYLVCAKMPFYMSKVERSLKTSFVDAASSLYYIECYYLFSSISKLFEVCHFDSNLRFSWTFRIHKVRNPNP